MMNLVNKVQKVKNIDALYDILINLSCQEIQDLYFEEAFPVWGEGPYDSSNILSWDEESHSLLFLDRLDKKGSLIFDEAPDAWGPQTVDDIPWYSDYHQHSVT